MVFKGVLHLLWVTLVGRLNAQVTVTHIADTHTHHVPDTLGRAYNCTKYIDERKRMMQVWADYLEGLVVKRL